MALAAAMALLALNVWTGSPLAAMWIASRVQGGTTQLNMTAFFTFVVLFAVFSIGLFQLLKLVGGHYDRLTGQSAQTRAHLPWLRSMRGEREQYSDTSPALTAMERILVLMVVVVFVAFEVWFFFFSSSPIDTRSGRAEAPGVELAAVLRG